MMAEVCQVVVHIEGVEDSREQGEVATGCGDIGFPVGGICFFFSATILSSP